MSEEAKKIENVEIYVKEKNRQLSISVKINYSD